MDMTLRGHFERRCAAMRKRAENAVNDAQRALFLEAAELFAKRARAENEARENSSE